MSDTQNVPGPDGPEANRSSNVAFIGAIVLLVGAPVDYGGGFSLVEYRGQPIGRFIGTALYWWLPVAIAVIGGILAMRASLRALAAGLCVAEGLQSGASAMGPLLFGADAGIGFFLTLAGAALLLVSGVVGAIASGGPSMGSISPRQPGRG